jgi:hypothetical protein
LQSDDDARSSRRFLSLSAAVEPLHRSRVGIFQGRRAFILVGFLCSMKFKTEVNASSRSFLSSSAAVEPIWAMPVLQDGSECLQPQFSCGICSLEPRWAMASSSRELVGRAAITYFCM